MDPIYRNSSFSMDREVSRSIENKNTRNSFREAIEDLSRGVHSKRGSMDREGIKHLSIIWVKLSIYQNFVPRTFVKL